MVGNEAKIRVRLDTKRAKGELRGLVRESRRSAGRLTSNVRGALGRGARFFGAGAAFGGGLQAIRAPIESGIGDAFGEAFDSIGRNFSSDVLGEVGDRSRAAKSTREEFMQNFAQIVGARGEVTSDMRGLFKNIVQIREQEERGRRLIGIEPGFQGPGVGEVAGKVASGVGEKILEGFRSVGDTIERLWNGR